MKNMMAVLLTCLALVFDAAAFCPPANGLSRARLGVRPQPTMIWGGGGGKKQGEKGKKKKNTWNYREGDSNVVDDEDDLIIVPATTYFDSKGTDPVVATIAICAVFVPLTILAFWFNQPLPDVSQPPPELTYEQMVTPSKKLR